MGIEEATSLNIAILPDNRVTGLAISASQIVSVGYPTEFVLDQETFIPHTTVFQAHFPKQNIPIVLERVASIAEHQAPFNLTLAERSISLDTFLWWNFLRSRVLQNLHDKVVKATNPLRQSLVLPHLVRVTGMTEEDRHDMTEFGSLKIGPRFSPHITITKLSDPKDANDALLRSGLYRKESFGVAKIIVGQLGSNGTVNGVIRAFDLEG